MFYRAEYGKKLDKAIALWTGGPFSHVELRFDDEVCFSSSARDGGTRFKTIQPDGHWEILKLPDEDARIRKWCQKHIGLPYDYLGVFGLALGQKKLEGHQRWYCSEIIATVLKKFNAIEMRSTRIDPNRFYQFLIGQGFHVEKTL